MKAGYKETIGIIGARGFIGTHLIRHFSAVKIAYTCFSGNLLKDNDISFFFKVNNISTAVFLVGTFDQSFENLIKTNVLTLNNFLHIGIKHNLKKIIFISSGAVYGEPIRKQSRENDLLHPNTFYGLSKLLAEECIKFYKNNYGLQYIILRCPNVYGEGNKKGAIYNFLYSIKNNKKVTIEGGGKQKRDFLHVSDLCLAITKALRYKDFNIFNISNIKCLSINEVIKQLKNKYNFSIKKAPSRNNLYTLSLDINRAKKELGFFPKNIKLKI